jgi:hypothetical protein
LSEIATLATIGDASEAPPVAELRLTVKLRVPPITLASMTGMEMMAGVLSPAAQETVPAA